MRPVAWNGTAEEFWAAIEKVRAGTDVEGDQAVLLDVIQEAMRARDKQGLVNYAIKQLRGFGGDIELLAGAIYNVAERIGQVDPVNAAAADGKGGAE